MKRIALLLLIVFSLTMSLTAQEAEEIELVTIQVIEIRKDYTVGGLVPLIHITENDGSYRVIELEKHTKRYLSSPTENQKKIHNELKKYLQSGYRIEGYTRGLESLALFYENYVLIKD